LPVPSLAQIQSSRSSHKGSDYGASPNAPGDVSPSLGLRVPVSAGDGPSPPRQEPKQMSRKDAHAFASTQCVDPSQSCSWSPAWYSRQGMELLVPSPSMKSTATRFKWSLRSTRGHNAHGLCRWLGIRAGAPIWAVRLSDVPVARKSEPTRRSALPPKEPHARCRAYGPPDTSRKSFTRATLMK